jgi:putative glycosyltransferase (TIGR04348 family)
MPVRVALICPAPPRSRLGNRITALRWQHMLRELGHGAFIATGATSRLYDAMIALHARKSAEAVRASRQLHPHRPVVVALTGTDLYRDIHQDLAAKRSLQLADWLIVLHSGAARELPPALRRKVRLVPQSASEVRRKPVPAAHRFEVAVVAHLRKVKDPLRTARAARLLPADARLRVLHAGRSLSREMKRAALREQQVNPRYRWLGELPRWRARLLIARSRLLVVTSQMEGGANVVSEALAADTPVIASRIPAMEAILGRSYPGLFPLGSTEGLARLLVRAEREPAFLAELRQRCRARRAVVSPAREKAALRALLVELARRSERPPGGAVRS